MSKDFEAELNKIVSEYGEEINDKVQQITDEVANHAVETLKSTSPMKSGKYASSWTTKEGETSSKRKTQIIHNAKHYRLTHLLEWGHAKVNGGRVAARPHIQRVEQESIREFEEKLKGAIEQ